MEQAAASSRERIRIVEAANDSIVLGNWAMRWAEPWSAVERVTVARVPFGASTILIAVLCIDCVDDQRTVMTSEADPNWHQVLRELPRALAGIEAFEVWSQRPNIGSQAIVIYDRRGRQS